MRCPHCREENPEKSRFCSFCGSRLAASCASCGAELTAGARFCAQCGMPCAAAATGVEARFASPQTYTPKHLAERILAAGIEGERKQVTVLFADMKGSMELLAERDPEDARKLLDPVLERMMEAVHHYEGTVNQVMGDGIMALFGAPLAHEDHAVRACYAALRMQESMRRYSEESRRRHGVELRIRVGLNSGEVVVRSIGSDLRMDYSAVGQTTHLAARMEQLATPGTVRLTAATLALAEGYVEVKPLGPVPVKGVGEPVEVHELLAASAVRTRLQAARARGLTRFVGRDTEMEQLRQAAEAARAGRGQVTAVVGEPGVGKSRLYYEFIHSHRSHGWLVVESSSVSYGKATPYLPLADAFRGYFKIGAHDDIRTVRAKVTGNLLTLDESLKDAVPAALWLLDALPEEHGLRALDPAGRRRQTLLAAKRILLRECRVQPLMLVFEDLHWIDEETQAFLDSLVDSLPSAPILLAVNYRPEYRHDWSARSFYRQLRIDALPPQSAQELLEGLVGADASVEPLKPLLIQRTQGNPLFLEESVRTLVETGALSGSRGAYRLSGPLDNIRVPGTVQAILAARIDRLAPADKQLLQAAAAVGTDVPFALIEAVAGLDGDALRLGLARLQGAEFLHESRLFPELEYAFKHALTHDVTYGSVLQERKRALHAAIVEAIERLYADRLAEQMELLAHHASRGSPPEKAVHYLREAGMRAISRCADRQAIDYLERALSILSEMPPAREVQEQMLDIRIALGPALVGAKGAASPEFEAAYVHAQDLAERLSDDARRFPVLWGLWFNRFNRGDYPDATQRAVGLLEIARRTGDASFLLEAHHSAWATLSSSGRSLEVMPHADQGIALYDPAQHATQAFVYGGHDAGSCARYHRGLTNWLLGFPERGIADTRKGVAMSEELGHPQTLTLALWFDAFVRFHCGDLEATAATAERFVAVAQAGDLGRSGEAASLLAATRGAAGMRELDEAERQLAAYTSTAWRRSFNVCLLAQLYGRAGAPEKGQQLLAALPAEHRSAFYAAEIARVEGELALQGDRSAIREAEHCFRNALQIAQARGEKSLELRAAMSLARLCHDTGRREIGRALLAPIYGAFSEGLGTADLRAARELLSALG